MINTFMRFRELLTERVVNAFNADTMEKYADQVWDILQKSYANVKGGFGTAATIQELIDKSNLWKIVTRNGKVTAVAIYKDKFGRKSIAVGTDGTVQGKRDFAMLRTSDLKLKRSWSEVSGAVEKLTAKYGATPLPAKFAEILTGKEILEYNPDGFHYTRLIGGEPHEKIIYGFVNVTPELEEKLSSAGIDLHDLPDTFLRK